MFYLLLFVGFIIRLLFIPVPGFKADIAFWKGWGLAAADRGIIWLVNNTNFNYPPGFAYILWAINKVYALLKNPYNINEYWLDTNVTYLFLIKIITIIADIGIVFLILKISKKLNFRFGKILALFYFLNPVVIFDGVIWGQVDQFGLFLFLASVYFLLEEKIELASVIFAVSFLLKFQNIIFIPLFYLFLYKKYSWQKMIEGLKWSFFTFVIVIFPFWFYREMAALVRLLTINANWFPWYSLNAFNIWWILSGLKGMDISDKTLFIGIVNAKTVSLLAFSFFYFIAVAAVFFSKKEDLFKQFLISLTLVAFSFFHILTQSHERYLFPLLVLLLIYRKNFSIVYILFSILFFLNLYLSMQFNYPDQVFWPFSNEITRAFTFLISVCQIGLFLYFFLESFSGWLVKYWYIFSSVGLLLIAFIFVKNLPYIFGKPISLTSIVPIYEKQDYLAPVYNMSVESSRGVFSWNKLSNNYYFYDKGIGGHADSEIRYGLGGRFSRFKTDIGVDTEAALSAKVYFTVEGDGRELFRSKEKGRFDLPDTITVPIEGVNILTLKILKVGENNYGDHADWLNPVLLR